MSYHLEMSNSRRRHIGAVSLVSVMAFFMAACSADGRDMRSPSADQTQSIETATTITPTDDAPPSAVFAITGPWVSGGAIDTKYTCTGGSISPPLQFSGIPAGTVTLGLVLTDQDANDTVHWATANINTTDANIGEGTVPGGAIQAITAQGTLGYWAPCPPAGQTHNYLLTAYAVSQQLEFADGVDTATLHTALEAAALSVAETSFVVQTP